MYSENIFQIDTKASKTFINKLVKNTTSYTQSQSFKKVSKSSEESHQRARTYLFSTAAG